MRKTGIEAAQFVGDEDLKGIHGGNRQELPMNRPATNWTGAWGMQKGGTTDPVPSSIGAGDSIFDNSPIF